MTEHRAAIDISDMPDLLGIIEEIARTKRPRVLRRGSTDVAVVLPLPRKESTHRRTAPDPEAALSAGGSWKGVVDGESLKARIHAERGSSRSTSSL